MSLLTCSFGMIADCRCDRARFSRGCHLRESAPCLAHQAIAPAEASLSLTLRGLRSLTRAASLVLLVSQQFSFCDHARTHSSVEHTSAFTGTVRDPRDQPSSSPRSTSSRCPFITGSSCSSSSPGALLPLSARSLTRDQSSSLVERTTSSQDWTSPHSDPRKQPPQTQCWYAGTVPCPLPVASLTCLHIRDTRSLLEVRLSLECRWPAACSEELCQSPDFLVGTCLDISQLLALNAAHSSQPAFSLERLATAHSAPDTVPHTDPRAVLVWTERDDMLCPSPNNVFN